MKTTKLATLILSATLPACVLAPQSAVDEEFGEAVPRAEQVAINVPNGSASGSGTIRAAETAAGATTPVRAKFYQTTYDTSRGVNTMVFALLSMIKNVNTWPATTESDNTRTWGPWTDALSPVTNTFTMTKVAAKTMAFSLKSKPKQAEDSAYVEVLAGTYVGIEKGKGYGDIFIDATAAHSVDPYGNKGVGRIDIHWDAANHDWRQVEVTLKDWAETAADQLASAFYSYKENPDQSGTFQFVAHADINKDNDPLHQYTKLEDFSIVSAWLASGAGRSDVVVSGGDLTVPAVHASECWDQLFWRTYWSDDAAIDSAFGTPEACVIPAPQS